jgi:A/G-specific adenine glycosylase
MLQQTQVDRVIPKYKAFLKAFPSLEALAAASNKDILALWSGLGYNRRALFLKRAAEYAIREYQGRLPRTVLGLQNLPGVGPYTAAAVATFAFNTPNVMIETNIRAVFLYEFFSGQKNVSDAKILPLIETSLKRENPREWYWALMDYGSHLKRTVPNPSQKSAHHTVQSKFKGSIREARGLIIRLCTNGPVTEKDLLRSYTDMEKRRPGRSGSMSRTVLDREKMREALSSLVEEDILIVKRGKICIK